MVLRRIVSVPALALLALALVVLSPLWLPLAALWDCLRSRWRWAHVRLLAFATWWAWLETIGMLVAGWLLVTGRARDLGPHYRLQRWWANGLVVGLRRTCRLTLQARNLDVLVPGPVIVLPRHASLADALLSAWFVTRPGLEPHYVLKRELLVDPCLDIVGNRLRNHFLDRTAADAGPELAAIEALAREVRDPDECIVIFPEGTRANPTKQARALARLAERSPERAARFAGLRHCNPPRPAGTLAVLAGAPDADVVLMAHAGFEGLDSFRGILTAIPGSAPVLLDCERIPRAEVPTDPTEQIAWLDAQWLRVDQKVDDLLRERNALVAEAERRHR